MITEEVSISIRKFPLEDIRKNLLIRHTKYMRLTTDEEFEVYQKLKTLGEFSDNSETLEELLIKLKKWTVHVILYFGTMVQQLETTGTF